MEEILSEDRLLHQRDGYTSFRIPFIISEGGQFQQGIEG